MKPCLKPHPRFELILRCKDTGEVANIWQLDMISQDGSQYPAYDPDFVEAMDAYDGKMKCDCINCRSRE